MYIPRGHLRKGNSLSFINLFCEEIDLALATGCINCINVVHEMRYGQYYHHLYNRSPSRDHVMNAKLMLDFTTNNNFARPDIVNKSIHILIKPLQSWF
jgi:hypothetical protein